MKLEWKGRQGPSTTQELADEIEREGKLITGLLTSSMGRCLWGVIEDCHGEPTHTYIGRNLTQHSAYWLCFYQLGTAQNDAFPGTPEERCAEMTRRCRAIP